MIVKFYDLNVVKPFKTGLHYGDYRSKLVHSKGKKTFSMFKKALALLQYKNCFNVIISNML